MPIDKFGDGKNGSKPVRFPLHALTRDVVEACIKYYHDKRELNSKSTMELHFESVKSFYDYLSEAGKAMDFLTMGSV